MVNAVLESLDCLGRNDQKRLMTAVDKVFPEFEEFEKRKTKGRGKPCPWLAGYFRMHCTHHVNQASINVSFLSNKVFLHLPPLPEQHQIVSEIERRFSVADEVEKIVDQSLKQAERLKQSILKRAFEGKLVPQDPNDEPASVLLERIKKNQEKLKTNIKAKKDGTKRKRPAKAKNTGQ